MPERDMNPDELERLEEQVVQRRDRKDDLGRPASEAESLPDRDDRPRIPVPPPPD